jgi:hypothetical protein
MAEDWTGLQGREPKGDLKLQITQLGLEHRLMTQFTSFVAVEEQTVTEGGEVKTIQVPVEIPQGVSYEGVFGEKDGAAVNGRSFQTTTVSVSAASEMVEVVDGQAPMIDMAKSSVNYAATPELPSSGGTRGRSDRKSKRDLLEDKADKEVLNAWECNALGANNPSAPASCKEAAREKVHVRIDATQVTEELKRKLVKMGFVQDANTDGKTLVGTLPIAKLKEVTALSEVTGINMVASKS